MDKFTGSLRVIVSPSTAEGTRIVIYALSDTKKLEDVKLQATVKEYPVIGKAAVFHHLIPGDYRLGTGETVEVEAGKQKDINLSTNVPKPHKP